VPSKAAIPAMLAPGVSEVTRAPWKATAFSATFEVLDAQGLRLTSPAVTVDLALQSGSVPYGSTLQGATAQTSSLGLVTFSGLSVDKTGNYRFRATSGTLNPGVTSILSVDVGAPARLAFTSYPRVGTVNEALGGTVPIHVELQDAQGNPVVASTTTPVTLGLAVPGGAAITDGGPVDITGTEALFSNPYIDRTGTYQLTASTSVPGIAPATMPEDLTIYAQDTSGDITGLQLGIVPSGPTPVGTSLGTVTVEVVGASGVLTTADGIIELRICGCGAAPGAVNENPTTLGPSTGPRQTTLTAPVVNGVATFSAANGNDISFIRAGTWSISATYSKGTLYTAFFPPVQFDPGPTARLAFDPAPFAPFPSAAGPTDVGAAQPSPSPVAVQARDAWGNDNYSETGTVSLSFNTAGNPLASATPVAATSGLASFDTWMVPSGRLGVQTLLASLGSVTGLSNPFTVWIEPTDLDSAGALPTDRIFSTGPNCVSADGRYVVFEQQKPGSSRFDVWRRDRVSGTTTLVSAGAEAATDCFYPAISPDGKLVTFTAWRSNPSDTVFGLAHNGSPQVFLWSETEPLKLVSHNATGGTANGPSAGSDVNDAGTVVYTSEARDLVTGKSLPFGSLQVYAASGADLTNQLVSETPAGRGMNMPASLGIGCMPSISATGHVAFQVFVPTNNMPGARDFTFAVYRRDLAASPGLVLVSDNGTGTSADHQCWWPAISDDGRYVAFTSAAPDLPDASALGSFQVYRRDCNGSEMLCVSAGLQVPAGSSNPGSTYPSLSADGRYVAFLSSDELAGVYTPSFASVIWRRDCNSAGTGAFALMTRNSAGQPLEVPTGFLTTPADAWPSLAAANPTLCGFVAEEDAGYGYWGGTGQVYMTYTP